MARFLTTPLFKKISEATSTGRATWSLEGNLVYEAKNGRVFTVPSGFKTDFASVPRVPVAYWLTGDTAHLSAVLHDYLCRIHVPSDMTWKEAAEYFREAMRVEGVPSWRAYVMYWAVRLADPTASWEKNNGADS